MWDDECTRCGCRRQEHNCTDSGRRDGTCFADLTNNMPHKNGLWSRELTCHSFSTNKKYLRKDGETREDYVKRLQEMEASKVKGSSK